MKATIVGRLIASSIACCTLWLASAGTCFPVMSLIHRPRKSPACWRIVKPADFAADTSAGVPGASSTWPERTALSAAVGTAITLITTVL